MAKWEPTQWRMQLPDGHAQADRDIDRRRRVTWEWFIETPHFKASGQAQSKESAVASAEALIKTMPPPKEESQENEGP